MHNLVKKIFFLATFNSCLFIILVTGIQNSSNTSKVDLLIDKTISLPIGFITGTSFITGSLFGNLLTVNFYKKRK
ncbi:conserved hypothetical protein [Prochlorococcus marinus str. MIT 9515]|uniref:Uncharacterized protein n=1 Tax=Prochlorococcus marinus (strain MIT 9515) TaxID=167542 RepID=A2BXR2_PROM5|nr:hypothetical protein [Prochlorococcus marinus]ABM72573.1 conserved hypothetical protein [Prochlorococcus marinus str. MIT 9515]